MRNKVYFYRYSDGDGPHSDSGEGYIIVPSHVDFHCYILGRKHEAARSGYTLSDFAAAPEMQHFAVRVKESYAGHEREYMDDRFHTSREDCEAWLAALIADPDNDVIDAEIVS